MKEASPIELKALRITNRLKEVSVNHHRRYPSVIEAVLVFSGPGTYRKRLKPGQGEWMRWMDRDRIRAGIAVAREIRKRSDAYPYIIYNGIPEENATIREVDRDYLWRPHELKVPRNRFVILDELSEEDGTKHSYRHTGDQVKGLFQALRDEKSPLFGLRRIAVVSHVSHFIRIPNYLKKFNDEHENLGYPRVDFYAYSLKNRKNVEETYETSELSSLVEYAKKGHLSQEPESLYY